MSIINSDWLKYGFIGLVAIVDLLLYFLIKPLIKTDPNKKFWSILFIATSMILLALGGTSSYFNDRLKFNNKNTIDSIKNINQSLVEKLRIYTDRTPQNDSLRAKIQSNKNSYDSLLKINNELENRIRDAQGTISNLAQNLVVTALESDFEATSGKKRLNIKDLDYERIRGAVFLNMLAFDADKSILKQALIAYHKETGEFSILVINRIIEAFPNLMRIRLKWLKQEAIPALQAQISHLSQFSTQGPISVYLEMPPELIIYKIGDNRQVVDNMANLIKEKDLLTKRLSEE